MIWKYLQKKKKKTNIGTSMYGSNSIDALFVFA